MRRMKDIIGDMREQSGIPVTIPETIPEAIPKSQQRRLDVQMRARAHESVPMHAHVPEVKVDPVVEQAARSFHRNDDAALGTLDMIVQAGRRENAKEVKHHPDRRKVESHVPPKMQGTPLEGLIMELGGGSTNADLGIPTNGGGASQAVAAPPPIVNVPGMEQFLEQPKIESKMGEVLKEQGGGELEYSDQNRLLRLRKDAERMVESLGGKVIWEG